MGEIMVGAPCPHVRIIGATVSSNSQASPGTYNGILMDGSQRFQLVGVTSAGAAQSYGIFINTASDYFVATGCNVFGNINYGIGCVPGTLSNRRELIGNIY